MKPETITSAIRLTLAARTTAKREASARQRVLSAVDAWDSEVRVPESLEKHLAARSASRAARSDLKRIPAPRRTLAADIIAAAERIGHLAAHLGEGYSGNTCYSTQWADIATASTATGQGSRYSRRCTYRKTDADHSVALDPAGVALLVEAENLRNLSARDGLHLIALYPDDSAVWVKRHGKAITSERGWIIGNAAVCYHSTKSREHARAGFEKKNAAHLKELRQRRLSDKQERRARLVARLCGGITATLEDARALGYCAPGIQAFQSRYGIGDSATLPELVRTGDPSACRLALSLARKVATV